MPNRAWAALRRRLLEAVGYRCEGCGLAGKLEVHHLDGNRSNDATGNLRVLCVDCHRAEHDTRGPGAREWAEWVRELRGSGGDR